MSLRDLLRHVFSVLALVATEAWAVLAFTTGGAWVGAAVGFIAAFGVVLGLEPYLAWKRRGPLPHDRELHAKLLEGLPDDQMRFFRDHNFLGSYRESSTAPLFELLHYWDDPKKEFIDDRLEKARRRLFEKAEHLQDLICSYTSPVQGVRGTGEDRWYSVWPNKGEGGPMPERFEDEGRQMNAAAKAFVEEYERFVRETRMLIAE